MVLNVAEAVSEVPKKVNASLNSF